MLCITKVGGGTPPLRKVRLEILYRKQKSLPANGRDLNLIFKVVYFRSEEYTLCLLLDFSGCDEGDLGGITVLSCNDLLGGPREELFVPSVY